jgi:hypothetical protein
MMTNRKGLGRKCLWPNFKVLLWHLPGGLRETTKNLNQDCRLPGLRFEPGTSRIGSRSVNH